MPATLFENTTDNKYNLNAERIQLLMKNARFERCWQRIPDHLSDHYYGMKFVIC